jgi:DoxX-like family
MKTIDRRYWILTALMALFILAGAIFDVTKNPDALALIKGLGYPEYFVPFIGVMKILGVLTVVALPWPKLKEWAYAGLVFDTSGALFSHFSTQDKTEHWIPALVGLVLIAASYALYSRRASTTRLEPSMLRMGLQK